MGVNRSGRNWAGSATLVHQACALARLVPAVLCLGLLCLALPGGSPAAEIGPDPPRWVAARYLEKEKHVGLRWTLVKGASAYRLWRMASEEPGEKLLATVEGLQYLDTVVQPGGLYRYRLQSVLGSEGGSFSEEETVRIPAATVAGEIAASSFRSYRIQAVEEQGRPTRYQVAFRVRPVPGAIGYNLYRSQNGGTGSVQVGFHASTRFVDTGLELDQTYYYVVTASDAAFKESPRSLELAVRVRPEAIEDVLIAGTRSFPVEFVWEVGNEIPSGIPSNRRAGLTDPGDLAYDRVRKRLYVSSTAQRHIVVINGEGEATGYLGPRFGASELQQPLGLAVDGAGSLIVVDQAQSALFVIAPDGTLRRRIAVGGKGLGKPPRLMDVAVLRDGRLLVTDNANGTVHVLSAEGKPLARWGKSGGRPEEFAGIGAIEVAADGSFAVADAAAGAVKMYSRQGRFLKALGGRTAAKGGIAFMGGFTALGKGRFLVSDLLDGGLKLLGPGAAEAVPLPVGTVAGSAFPLLGPVAVAGNGLGLLFVADGIGNRVISVRLQSSLPGSGP